MKLLELLEKNVINLDCSCQKKEAVLREFISLVAKKTGQILDAEKLFEQVIQKDNIESSGVGHEIAIIHARGNLVKGLIVTMAICKDGLDFNAKDKKRARILFFVAASEENNREYLTMLATISRMFRNSELIEEVLEAKNEREILEIIRNWSQ